MNREKYSQLGEAFEAELQRHNTEIAELMPLRAAAQQAETAYRTFVSKYGTMREWRDRATRADNDEATRLQLAHRDACSDWNDAIRLWRETRGAIEARWSGCGLSETDYYQVSVHRVPVPSGLDPL